MNQMRYNEILQKKHAKKLILQNFLNANKETRRVMVAAVNRDNEARNRRTESLIKRIYELHGVGGPLHIVLDDENVEDYHVLWCLTDVIDDYICKDLTPEENEELRSLSRECATCLLEMSYSKRLKIIRNAITSN